MAPGTGRRFRAVPRRSFLRASLLGSVSAGLGGFALSAVGFMWPRPGDAVQRAARIGAERAPLRVPEGGVSIVRWDPSVRAAARTYGDQHAVVSEDVGLMALFTRTCPHLGCAVPWCQSSQWFECPCHGSRYNRYGEWTRGPAPRGLDRFGSTVAEDGQLVIDFSTLLTGTARSANVLEQSPEGPACG